MNAIQCEFAFEQDDKGRNLIIRIRQLGRGFQTAYLLSEMGESLLHAPDRLLFDLSALSFIDSSCLGAVSNIAEKARAMNKKIRFQLPRDFLENMGHSGFLERLHID